MIADWTKGLSKAEAEDFEQYLRNSTRIFKRVQDILADLDQQANKTSKQDYDKPGWPYYRADLDGQRRVIAKMKSLFTLT